MDPFQILLCLILFAIFIMIGRPFVGLFNMALRGWIKSCRKTIDLIRN